MRGSPFFLALLLPVLLGAGEGEAEPRTFDVGVLFWHDSPNDTVAFAGVKEGFALAEMQVRFDVRNVKESRPRALELLAGWEKKGFDLIYAMGTSAALLAKEHVAKIPVVFTAVTSPLGRNLAPSWEGCGGNLCGNSNWIATRDVIRVFKAAVPDLFRLGVLLNPENPVSMEEVAEARRFFKESPDQAIRLLEQAIAGPDDLEEAVGQVIDRGAQAIWVPIDITVYHPESLETVANAAARRGVPLLSSQSSAMTHAVVSVAVDYRLLGQRSVVLAEKVLEKGADPGKLEVGRLLSFKVRVNLAAARRAGFEVPLPFLAIADEILDPGEAAR